MFQHMDHIGLTFLNLLTSLTNFIGLDWFNSNPNDRVEDTCVDLPAKFTPLQIVFNYSTVLFSSLPAKPPIPMMLPQGTSSIGNKSLPMNRYKQKYSKERFVEPIITPRFV